MTIRFDPYAIQREIEMELRRIPEQMLEGKGKKLQHIPHGARSVKLSDRSARISILIERKEEIQQQVADSIPDSAKAEASQYRADLEIGVEVSYLRDLLLMEYAHHFGHELETHDLFIGYGFRAFLVLKEAGSDSEESEDGDLHPQQWVTPKG